MCFFSSRFAETAAYIKKARDTERESSFVDREPRYMVYGSHPSASVTLPLAFMMSLASWLENLRSPTLMNQRWFFLFVPIRMLLSWLGDHTFLNVVVFIMIVLLLEVDH